MLCSATWMNALDFAAGVADVDQALAHHIQLLQGVGVLRVLDVPDVLQGGKGVTVMWLFNGTQ